jgi:histidyl-tRNA synthetase
LAELCGGAGKMNEIALVIDKLDKIGLEKVKDDLVQKGLNKQQVNIIGKYLKISGGNEEKLIQLNELLGSTESGKKGIQEVREIFDNSHLSSINYHLDLNLARGLNYYTGIIFEVKTKDVTIGSIGGGGRYDDLTGLFGVPGIPGVGISFGVDRIYDVMEELKLFPENVHIGTQLLFFNLGETAGRKAFELMQQLRHLGIRCEIYHEPIKPDKQFKYAEKKNIPYVVIIGKEEVEKKSCKIKNIITGIQSEIDWKELPGFSFT